MKAGLRWGVCCAGGGKLGLGKSSGQSKSILHGMTGDKCSVDGAGGRLSCTTSTLDFHSHFHFRPGVAHLSHL